MSRSSARSVSTSIRLVSMGSSPEPGPQDRRRSGPCRRPSPRTAPGSRSGPSSSTVPSASCSQVASTWFPKLPSTWWFFPWMSAAIAPPTVTKRVPGVTGTNQALAGTSRSSRACDAGPGPGGHRAGRQVEVDRRRAPSWSSTTGPRRSARRRRRLARAHGRSGPAARRRPARRRPPPGCSAASTVAAVDGGASPSGQQQPARRAAPQPRMSPTPNRTIQMTPMSCSRRSRRNRSSGVAPSPTSTASA